MAKTMLVEILTPERVFFKGEVEEIIVLSIDGETGILPDHRQMINALDIGPMRMRIGGEWKEAALSGGFLVVAHNEVHMMVQSALWPEEVDVARSEEMRARSEEALRQKQSREEYLRNKAMLARAMVRLRVTNKINHLS